MIMNVVYSWVWAVITLDLESCLSNSMCFTLFASDALEITHVRSIEWTSINCQMIDPGRFGSALVILYKYEQRLYVLELDKTEVDGISIQIRRLQTIQEKNLNIKYLKKDK